MAFTEDAFLRILNPSIFVQKKDFRFVFVN